ncbi:MAG TPA: glycosyltransferase family 2 protein [Pyrinomonadaceae bacterium]
MRISAVIITFNEAANIREACATVAWADDILVVDSESTDQTRAFAADCGARVLINPWPGFAAQKQLATDSATHNWIFSLDADERVSDELKASVENLRNTDESKLADGYRVARRTRYMDRWIQGGGWYPDYQLRLFNRKKGNWGNRIIHESVVMDSGARIEILPGDLLHYTVHDPAQHQQMIEQRYAPLGAQQMYRDGKRTSSLQAAVAGPAAFLRSFVLKGGFRDGAAGLTIAKFAARHASLKHSLLQQLQNQKPD